jgi:peptidoglycan/xylan/chitin deacetylase (PgdA/CDA1 family)
MNIPRSPCAHKIVLTFDDGPHPKNTSRILDTLAKYNVPAVFFVVGGRLKDPCAREIVRRAAREGHLIGNHTFDHPNLTELSPNEIRTQILRTHDLIAEFEPKRRLFRPPYGACNDAVRAIAKELDYEVVFWNSSAEDWLPEYESPAWVDNAVAQVSVQHIAICLCHDPKPHTAEYLPRFIEQVQLLSEHRFVSYYDRRKITTVADVQWLVRAVGRRACKWAKWRRLAA